MRLDIVRGSPYDINMTVVTPSQISDVLLCEDHPFVQLGLEVSLSKLLPNLKSLRKSALGKEALGMIATQKPDLAFIDLGLPDMSGVDVIRSLKQSYPDLKIIVVTNCDNGATLLEVQRLGVSGIMQKISSQEQLQGILAEVFLRKDGLPVLDKNTEGILKSQEAVELTPREYDVLQEVVQGKSNQQIADKLGCAVTTVRFHRANILDKTGVRNAAELTAWFLQGQRKRH